MDAGGFVTMHDGSLLDGDALGSVVGVSEHLGPGSYEDVTVSLDDELTEDQTLIAMPHRDTNDNEEYDFLATDGSEDGPYTDGDGAITDSADVTLESDTPNGSEETPGETEPAPDGTEPTPSETEMGTRTGSQKSDGTRDGNGTDDARTDANSPGFGLVTGIAGLGGLAAYAYQKLTLDSEPPTPADDGREDGEH